MHVRFYGFDFSVASLVFGCCCRRCGDALPLPLPLRLSLFASSLLYRRNTTNNHYDNLAGGSDTCARSLALLNVLLLLQRLFELDSNLWWLYPRGGYHNRPRYSPTSTPTSTSTHRPPSWLSLHNNHHYHIAYQHLFEAVAAAAALVVVVAL